MESGAVTPSTAATSVVGSRKPKADADPDESMEVADSDDDEEPVKAAGYVSLMLRDSKTRASRHGVARSRADTR